MECFSEEDYEDDDDDDDDDKGFRKSLWETFQGMPPETFQVSLLQEFDSTLELDYMLDIAWAKCHGLSFTI